MSKYCVNCDPSKSNWRGLSISERRARLLLHSLIIYLGLFFTPSPLWSSAYAMTEEIVKEKSSYEKLEEIELLRQTFAQKAADIIKLSSPYPGGKDRYGGLNRKQADAVLVIAETFGERYFKHAIKVAWCESRLNPAAVNGSNTNGTVDRGLFQLNDGGTMQRLGVDRQEVFDARVSALAALVLFEDRGWQPWVCAHKLDFDHLKMNREDRK
jgi:hypothetical protein